jgi:tetratricopeptide (TPR) repeat protein
VVFRALGPLVMVFAAGTLFAGEALQLDGHIQGDVHTHSLRVTLFGVEHPYAESTDVDRHADFHFRNLPPGNYTVAVVRAGLGEVRRTVVVSAALADKSGVVRTAIPYSAAEAAGNPTGATVSVRQVSVPGHASAKFADAQRLLAGRDPDGAVHSLEEAVAIAPDFSAAWNALGVIAFQNGEDARAEAFFRRSLEADPAAFEPLVNLGGELLKNGSAADALPFNRRAVRDRPEDALANAQLGMNYFKLDRLEEAEPYLLAAKRLDRAHFSQPQLFLADIYARRGNRSAAARELKELLELRPDGPLSASIRSNLANLVQ